MSARRYVKGGWSEEGSLVLVPPAELGDLPAWIGTDPVRAQVAYEAELASPTPRPEVAGIALAAVGAA